MVNPTKVVPKEMVHPLGTIFGQADTRTKGIAPAPPCLRAAAMPAAKLARLDTLIALPRPTRPPPPPPRPHHRARRFGFPPGDNGTLQFTAIHCIHQKRSPHNSLSFTFTSGHWIITPLSTTDSFASNTRIGATVWENDASFLPVAHFRGGPRSLRGRPLPASDRSIDHRGERRLEGGRAGDR